MDFGFVTLLTNWGVNLVVLNKKRIELELYLFFVWVVFGILVGENIIHIFFTPFYTYLRDAIILIFIIFVLKSKSYTKENKIIFFVLNFCFLVLDCFFMYPKYLNIFSQDERLFLYFVYLVCILANSIGMVFFKEEENIMFVCPGCTFYIILLASIWFLFTIFKKSILLFIISFPLLFLVGFYVVKLMISRKINRVKKEKK